VARDLAGTSAGRPAPLAPLATPPRPDATHVRAILSRHAGVLRNEAGLAIAAAALAPLAESHGPAADPALLGLMMVVAMQRRCESRGGHTRTDHPDKSAMLAQRLTLTWDQARTILRAGPSAAPVRQGPVSA
jgi:L-aspartate oxidase